MTNGDTDDKKALREAAIRINREICVRTGAFAGDQSDATERQWMREGVVKFSRLDTVRQAIANIG